MGPMSRAILAGVAGVLVSAATAGEPPAFTP